MSGRTIIIFIGFAILAGLLLSEEHRAHTMGVLPLLLILLLCPLMHFFMHGGHGHHGSADENGREAGSGLPPHRH